MKIPNLILFLLVIEFGFGFDGFLDSSAKHFQWIKQGFEYIDSNVEGSFDVVLVEDPSSDDLVRSTFYQFRRFLSSKLFVKIESTKLNIQTRKMILFVLDGSNFRALQISLLRFRQRRANLSDKMFEYFFILSTSSLTSQHISLFQLPLSCHMIFIHVTDDDLTIHRISSANSTHVRQFDANAPFELLFDDRTDWHGYNVSIWAFTTRFPYTALIDGVWRGVDAESFNAIFNHANMSYHYHIAQIMRDYRMFRRSIERLLRNGSIHMTSRRTFQGPYGEELLLRDTFGSCLLIPKSQQRHFIYHLVHPFEFGTWMVIIVVILLDLILGLFFPIAFPHNLIMILLFGDSLADHEQTRWTRFYCFACTVFLFLISEAYLAKAIIYMTLTRYAPDMKTLVGFLDSGIPILIQSGSLPIYNNSKLMSKLLSNSVEDPNFYFHLDSNQYAYIVHCLLGQELIDRQMKNNYLRYGREGKRMFYLLEERIQWMQGATLLQYRFMYYSRFQTAIRWLGDTGLWDKWLNDVQKQYGKPLQYELRNESDILYLKDLVAIWYVVAAGWTVSALTFALEVSWNYLKRNCQLWRLHR